MAYFRAFLRVLRNTRPIVLRYCPVGWQAEGWKKQISVLRNHNPLDNLPASKVTHLVQ